MSEPKTPQRWRVRTASTPTTSGASMRCAWIEALAEQLAVGNLAAQRDTRTRESADVVATDTQVTVRATGRVDFTHASPLSVTERPLAPFAGATGPAPDRAPAALEGQAETPERRVAPSTGGPGSQILVDEARWR